jgi:putative transcriptional regulator
MIICLLSSYIKHSKYSREDICKIFNIHPNTLSNWCTGKNYPSIPQALKLAALLNVGLNDLYILKEEKEIE